MYHRVNSFTLRDSQVQWTAKHCDSDIGSLRISPDGKTVAIGCFNGLLYIRNASRSRLITTIEVSTADSPITSVRWHPTDTNYVYAAAAKGFAACFSVDKGEKIWEIKEPTNSINSIDIAPNGEMFTTVGSDCAVRLYDMKSQALVNTLTTRVFFLGTVSGHSNRIFSGVFIDNNMIASCGWDDTVLLWDTRTDKPARSLFGPHVCGDSIVSLGGGKLATGSWRDKNQVQLWDIGTGETIASATIGKDSTALYVYCMTCTPNKEVLAAGGSHVNKVSFLRVEDLAHLSQTDQQSSAVNSVAFNDRQFVFGLADSTVHADNYRIN